MVESYGIVTWERKVGEIAAGSCFVAGLGGVGAYAAEQFVLGPG